MILVPTHFYFQDFKSWIVINYHKLAKICYVIQLKIKLFENYYKIRTMEVKIKNSKRYHETLEAAEELSQIRSIRLLCTGHIKFKLKNSYIKTIQ